MIYFTSDVFPWQFLHSFIIKVLCVLCLCVCVCGLLVSSQHAQFSLISCHDILQRAILRMHALPCVPLPWMKCFWKNLQLGARAHAHTQSCDDSTKGIGVRDWSGIVINTLVSYFAAVECRHAGSDRLSSSSDCVKNLRAAEHCGMQKVELSQLVKMDTRPSSCTPSPLWMWFIPHFASECARFQIFFKNGCGPASHYTSNPDLLVGPESAKGRNALIGVNDIIY
jgi:hypothetical protein